MNEERFILVALLVRGHVPRYYAYLEEEMFEELVNRRIIKSLKQGFKFTGDNWSELRNVADLSATDTAQLITDVDAFSGWITESDIKDFVKKYRNKKAAELYEKGDIKGAVEFIEDFTYRERNVIEEYENYLNDMRLKANVGLLGLPTGIYTLDNVTSGMRPSKVWIVGGYNAYGKTFFMTNMINRILDLKRRALVFTLEMTTVDIFDRLIGERLGLGAYEIAKTQHKEKVKEEVERLDNHIQTGHLIVDDSSYKLEDIIRRIKVENSNGKIDVIFIDFIQLIQDHQAKSKYDALSNIAVSLQEIAKEVNSCIMLLSQINNESQKSLSNDVYGFKGAGEIGQVADVAIKILRDRDDMGDFTNEYILDVIKNRSGRGGQIDCLITFPGGKIKEKVSKEPEVQEKVKKTKDLMDEIFNDV